MGNIVMQSPGDQTDQYVILIGNVRWVSLSSCLLGEGGKVELKLLTSRVLDPVEGEVAGSEGLGS